MSEGSVSNITNTIVENIKEWQQRPLEDIYFVVWMDGIVIKIRHNGKVQGKTIYLVIGLRKDGLKDILIACTDNLTGIRQAIQAVFPETISQLCVVHQIRNSARFVVWKERKEFLADRKLVYGAINKEVAYDALQEFEKKWTMPIRSWGIIINQFIIKFEDRCQI